MLAWIAGKSCTVLQHIRSDVSLRSAVRSDCWLMPGMRQPGSEKGGGDLGSMIKTSINRLMLVDNQMLRF